MYKYNICWVFSFDDEVYHVYSNEEHPHLGAPYWKYDGMPFKTSDDQIAEWKREYGSFEDPNPRMIRTYKLFT
jgi:hypothetical protein